MSIKDTTAGMVYLGSGTVSNSTNVKDMVALPPSSKSSRLSSRQSKVRRMIQTATD